MLRSWSDVFSLFRLFVQKIYIIVYVIYIYNCQRFFDGHVHIVRFYRILMVRIRMASDPKLDQLLQEVRHGPHGQVWTMHGDFVSADLGIRKKNAGLFPWNFPWIFDVYADISNDISCWYQISLFPMEFWLVSHLMFMLSDDFPRDFSMKQHDYRNASQENTHTQCPCSTWNDHASDSLTNCYLVTRGSSWIWPNQMARVYRNHGRKKQCLV
jgi:hypothetical protein